jgi:hypothetical protein
MPVTCKLIGRMGNQMFQVSAALAYAMRNELEFFMPASTVAPRVFPHYLAKLRVAQREKVPTFYKVYHEPSHRYHEIPYMPNVVLDGFFQSQKYFDDYRPQILDLFNELFPYRPLVGFVGLHVRRGDYLNFADKHPPVTYDYLRAAVLHFNGLGFKSFVVCSDDIPWCKENLRGLEVYTAHEDLALLACCEHQIISNSTFSWWAHYLNRNPDKICIAPELWFGAGNSNLDPQDIYFPNTIKLPA